ncbi:DUF3833 domain-containing protein [Vibrio sonorensis]|uniref:DUF3833 domain-containing protein n=1 Tax=Vibrio sonorensis TaxID=1004316 RepID=UPI0008D8DE80|nr:DUF3833 domain-containing protein [Vibrio sonorensis]
MRKSVVLFLSLFLVACTADLNQYQNSSPRFDLFNYFQGKTLAWGMVQDYTGKQTRRFEVMIIGEVKDDKLVLTEDFVFDDGEETRRIWTIVETRPGYYQGQADDIQGVAIGQEVGNALRWKYDFELALDDSTIVVEFDDWLYRQDDKHAFNLTKIKKFGIEVGQLTLFFQKQGE